MDNEDSSQVSSDAENSVTVQMFVCRKCPGKLFTAPEKDIHRKQHKEEKARNHQRASEPRKPGPASKRPRQPSPAPSAATLFAAVSQSPSSQASSRDERPPKRIRERHDNDNGSSTVSRGRAARPAPNSKKIRSVKNRPEPVTFNTTTGG